MSNKSALTLTQEQARFGVGMCVLIIFAIYFFEFSGTDINKSGLIEDVVGTITRCSESRDQDIKVDSAGKGIYLFLTTTKERAYNYSIPDSFRNKVLEACRTKARVKLTYRSYQSLLYDWTGYTVLSLVNEKNGKPYYTLDDYLAWKKQNRQVALIALTVACVALIYLLLVWFGYVRNRDVNEVKGSIRYYLEDDDSLIIKSSERNGDSWAFLILFSGLSIWLLVESFSNAEYWWLFAPAFTLIATYAYLVEVVNLNIFVIDHEFLLSFSKPLPWISQPVVIDVEDIDYFIGDEQMHLTSQGSVIEYSVSVQLLDEPEQIHLFFTKDLAEAEAVAELGNAKLGKNR